MSQPAVQKIHGKGATATMTPPGQTGTPVAYSIKFRKWTTEIERRMSNTTDSNDYDPTTGMVWPSQLPAGMNFKVTLEGVADFGIFNSVIVPAVCTAQGPSPVVLNLTQGTTPIIFGHGNFDFSNLKMDLVVNDDDPITFSVDAMVNGVFTFGA